MKMYLKLSLVFILSLGYWILWDGYTHVCANYQDIEFKEFVCKHKEVIKRVGIKPIKGKLFKRAE